jgi:hypothetical protein
MHVRTGISLHDYKSLPNHEREALWSLLTTPTNDDDGEVI